MTTQNGLSVCVLIFTGRVLLLAGLSTQTTESVEENSIGIRCKTWDASFSKCKECHSGFFGLNCMPCRYPSYGRDCQKECNCIETFCNSSSGCKAAACSVGYVGSSCDIPCRYPSFGFNCHSECICSEENCDHVIGCNDSSTFCNFEEGHKLQALMYSTLVLSVLAIFQISIYLYLALHSSSAIQLNLSYT